MFIGKYDKVYKVTTTINILTSWKQTFMLISAMQFGCHFTFCFDFNICFFLSTIALEWTFKKLKYFTHSAAVNFAANMPIMWTGNYLKYNLFFKLGSCLSLSSSDCHILYSNWFMDSTCPNLAIAKPNVIIKTKYISYETIWLWHVKQSYYICLHISHSSDPCLYFPCIFLSSYHVPFHAASPYSKTP